MATEAAERRAVVRAQQLGAPLPPVEQQDPLPCPRCTSTNTKFCYYNNYNFSQPRHFCKSCRRYWTHGGTLRDIPVGGGSRKTAKRSRTSSATSAASSPTSSCSGGVSSMGPMLEPIPINQNAPGGYTNGGGGGFTSLLSGGGGHAGLLALGGFGLGLGLDEMGFGLGRGVWGFQNNNNSHHHEEVGVYSGVHQQNNNGHGSNCKSGSNSNDHQQHHEGGLGVGRISLGAGEEGNVNRNDTWQVESGEVVGFVGGDCFTSLPELAISTSATTTSGNGLK